MTEFGNLIRCDGSSPINRMPPSIGYSVTEQTARNSHEAAKTLAEKGVNVNLESIGWKILGYANDYE